MIDIIYIGYDCEMSSVYTGKRWWFFTHRWMTDVGGIARVVILGRVIEIHKRRQDNERNPENEWSA